ncbi:hypothetical protein Hesp01_74890 [Herbidospora sp. NBRC 101105]|nr:hypothetical protein Hesp01_74890 [Herbidospora sp. NBRC 101105]
MVSTAVAAAIRARAGVAPQALRAAYRNGDAHAVLLAEEEWDDVRRLARAHSVLLPGGDDPREAVEGDEVEA